MVPFKHSAKMPLLPYEKQLIEALGIGLEEYQAYKHELLWQQYTRDPAYAGVPDVNADAITISIISLVVGLASTAASYLLAPKPRQAEAPGQQRAITNRQLDSLVGRDRFAPTYGFQSGQDISRYGETIPIVFTKQSRPTLQSGQTIYTGGVMVSPKLVWSRLFSWGTYQSADLVFLAGQGRMGRGPYSTTAEINEDRAGIYLGQTPLDAFDENDYRWFYYQGGEQNSTGIGYKTPSRLLGRHDRYGEFGPDIAATGNAFYAPTFAGGDSEAFSHSYSPNNQLRFGVQQAIPNGTPLRVNWEVVSSLQQFQEQARRDAMARRLQIAGNFRMRGTGRNYPRFIGIVAHNNTKTTFTGNNGAKVNTVQVGHTLTLVYGDVKLNESDLQAQGYYHSESTFRSGSVDNQSVISEILSELEQYDDQLQLGERVLVGNAVYKITKRESSQNAGTFNRTNKNAKFTITLTCEEIYDDGYIANGRGAAGLVNEQYVFNERALPENDLGPVVDIGQAWFPICKQDVASFQNVRACSYTEIGIKSQVWLRFNGLTNFIPLPGPEKLVDLDREDISVRSGTIQSYSTRYSFFNVYIREVKPQTSTAWIRLNDKPLGVRGNTPRDVFNYLRIAHPLGQWEFQIRPINSGELVQIIGRDSRYLRLDTKESFLQVRSAGGFTLYTKAIQERIADIAISPEMVNGRRSAITTQTQTDFTITLVKAQVNGVDANSKQISNGITKAINNDPDPDATESPYSNVPWRSQTPLNGFYTLSDSEAGQFTLQAGTKQMKLKLRLQAQQFPGPYNNNRDIWWRIDRITPIDITPSKSDKRWVDGEQFQVTKTLFDGRPIVYTFRLNLKRSTTLGNVNDAERLFEANAAISEVSHYGGLITRSCDNGPEHEIVYINESIDPNKNASYEGCAMAGLKIRSSRNLTALEQLHIYQKDGVQVQRYMVDPDGITQRNLGIGASNNFTDLVRYFMTDKQAGLGSILSSDMLDETSLRFTARYLEANVLFYDDVITEPSNIRDFIASIAPSLLCNMVTLNGKIGLQPALPYFANGLIYDQNAAPGKTLPEVPIKAIFTDGNIIEDTFELRYLSAEERKPMRVAMRYREEYPNRFPEQRTVVVSYSNSPQWLSAPLEEFNFTHITSQYHAILAAQYFLAIRRYVTHTVSFKTTPFGLSLAPGNFIRVVTSQNIVLRPNATNTDYNNGAILEDGSVVSVNELTPGTNYPVYLWTNQDLKVKEDNIYIEPDGKVKRQKNAIFALRNTQATRHQTYVIESLQVDEDGLVQVIASFFPTTDDNRSLISKEFVSPGSFSIETT